jgi:hypothetical protein
VLIRYKAVPQDLSRIVRFEWTENMQEKREMILHNAIAKYLVCQRQIWQMRGIFMKNMMPSLGAIEFILQTLMRQEIKGKERNSHYFLFSCRLRLNQGFKLAWNKNGIVNVRKEYILSYYLISLFILVGPPSPSRLVGGGWATANVGTIHHFWPNNGRKQQRCKCKQQPTKAMALLAKYTKIGIF